MPGNQYPFAANLPCMFTDPNTGNQLSFTANGSLTSPNFIMSLPASPAVPQLALGNLLGTNYFLVVDANGTGQGFLFNPANGQLGEYATNGNIFQSNSGYFFSDATQNTTYRGAAVTMSASSGSLGLTASTSIISYSSTGTYLNVNGGGANINLNNPGSGGGIDINDGGGSHGLQLTVGAGKLQMNGSTGYSGTITFGTGHSMTVVNGIITAYS